MKRRISRAFVVMALAAITLLMPLLVSSHRIDEAHRNLIREGMTAAEVENVFGAPAGTYDWAVRDESEYRLAYYRVLRVYEQAIVTRSAQALSARKLAVALRDSNWADNAQTWTSRHGSVMIFFDQNGQVNCVSGWHKVRVEPPWKKWLDKIKGK
jgi:hypothetical protein